MAPFYDLLCTQAYPSLAEKLAMKIGGENRPDWLQERHWERFSDSVELKPRYVLDRVRNVASRIAVEADALVHRLEENGEFRATVGSIREQVKKGAAKFAKVGAF